MNPPTPAGPGRWPTLALLFATAVGVIPAVEGIRIIKERRS